MNPDILSIDDVKPKRNEQAERITKTFLKKRGVPSFKPVRMPDPFPILHHEPLKLKTVGLIYRGPSNVLSIRLQD